MNTLDRRTFVVTASAAMGACAVATPVTAGAVSPAHIIVADTRFAISRAFARTAAKSGGRIVWIAGDITELWYGELDLLWRRQKVSLTGLTTYAPFFYLERLAMDRGLRVKAKDEHLQDGQRLVRWIIAPKPTPTGRTA
jgi:hypothetical protein